MLKIRRLGILAPIGLAIALLVTGLPTFALGNVVAQYYYSSGVGSGVGSAEGAFNNNLTITARVKIYHPTACYDGPSLKNYVATLNGPTAPDTFTSYLINPAFNGSAGYYAVWTGGANACYISTAGTTLVPR